jgi:penicillin-binding protein 2
MHAKTGTAEVYGKQTTSWFATYTKDYTIVMTISQGGTGSGASGPAVRHIYEALYGVSKDGTIDNRKALLPTPEKSLPKIESDGSIDAPKIKPYVPPKEATEETLALAGGQLPPATVASERTGTNRARRRRGRSTRRPQSTRRTI